MLIQTDLLTFFHDLSPDNLIHVLSTMTHYTTCTMYNAVLLSVKVAQQRWSMSILEMSEGTPAQRALEFAELGTDQY